MSDLSADPSGYRASERVLAGRLGERLQLAAVYGAMALIAGIVLGTMPHQPF